jgi:hypothetical protein
VSPIHAWDELTRTEAAADRLLVGSMKPWVARFPPGDSHMPLFGLPVVVHRYLKPDQWILLDRDGQIIAAGNGVK